jgi:hypothetical protein
MTIRVKRWHTIVIAAFLLLVIAGSVVAGLQASFEAKAVVGAMVATVAHSSPTPTPTQDWWGTTEWKEWTATPAVTSAEGCTLDSQYVADVTTPDGTAVNPGEGFAKTWKVKNSGTCDWHAGYELVFVSGEQMSGPASVSLPAVAAGTAADITVNLVAPTSQGAHKGTWRITSKGGEMFGTNLTVVIEVVAPEAVVPAVAPVATPRPGVTLTPGACPAVTPAAGWQ